MSYQPMTTMQGQSNIRLVQIPASVSRADKGHTKYDHWFTKMLDDEQAIQLPEGELEAVKKAAFRFMLYNDLKGKVSFRQHKDARTKTYVVWFRRIDESKT